MELLEGVRDVGDYPGSRRDGQSGRQGSSPDTNVEYYDAILGTPFLRKLGITLDFTSPGAVRIGNESVPIGKTSADDKSSTEGKRPASESSPESRPHLAN